eukprot:jgi/Chlat1/6096/Chrsp40S05684
MTTTAALCMWSLAPRSCHAAAAASTRTSLRRSHHRIPSQARSTFIGSPRSLLSHTRAITNRHGSNAPRWRVLTRCDSEQDSAAATDSPAAQAVAPASAPGKLSKLDGEEERPPLPTGELVYTPASSFERAWTLLRLRFSLPWRRFKYGSILSFELGGGPIPEKPTGGLPFSGVGKSLPQICQNLVKAANDPRVVGVFIKVSPVQCGWAKVEEIRRHIAYFRKSGKFTIAYMEVGGEKEYVLARACEEVYAPPGGYVTLRGLSVQGSYLRGVLDKVGVEPQVKRIGKYKSAGDQIARRDMSEPNREMLTAILDDLYTYFKNTTAADNGKTAEDVEKLLDEGWRSWRSRDGSRARAMKMNRVPPSALGLSSGGGDIIAIVRASGNITRGGTTSPSPLSGGSDGIRSDSFISQIRRIADNKSIKAVVLRIDSGGGDALASDLMWRELRQLASKKPLVCSMGDVAASGGYYMAMAGDVVIAEELTITGSIGVVTGKFSLAELFDRVGFNQTTISRGRYAEVLVSQRPFTEDEKDYFDRSAEHAYESFRNKAAESRRMPVEQMESVAQGRVWTGRQALEKGLVDALGGISTAVAIAKQYAKLEGGVRLVEFSRGQVSPLSLLSGGASVLTALSSLGSAIHLLKEEAASLQSGRVRASLDEPALRSLTGEDSMSTAVAMVAEAGSALAQLLPLPASREDDL